MKKIMYLYENCKMPLRTAFFGFMLMAFGFLIKNENVNIFYTFTNTYLLMFADGCALLGQTIVSNLPLIFMIYLVCKKANSGIPILLALVGYFSFLITMTLFVPQNLSSIAYTTNSGINAMININGNAKYPLETGMIGAFVVAFITRFSYIRSRHRSSHSLLGFLHKDSAALIYNVVLCTAAGMLFSYVGPLFYTYFAKGIVYISKNLDDPYKMLIYGFLDQTMSILGLSNAIRYPFWFTSLGGSFQTLSGQSIVGDVNIWQYVKDSVTTYTGAGRFITPYYVINLFMVPACYLGIYLSFTDKETKIKMLLPLILISLISIVCGSPLPLMLFLLFTSPLLLLGFVFIAACVYGYFTYAGVYLGSSISNYSTITALPGSFPDFIINIRSINHYDAIISIVMVGIICFVVVLALCILYYRHLCYMVVNPTKDEKTIKDIIEKLGGLDNIEGVSSGLLEVNFNLVDIENINTEELSTLAVPKIFETKTGVTLKMGSSSYIIAKYVNKYISEKDVKVESVEAE